MNAKKVVVWELYGKGRNCGCVPITPEAIRLIRILQVKVKLEEIEECIMVYKTPEEARQATPLTARDIQEVLNTFKAEALEEKGIILDPDYTGGELECTPRTSERCGKLFQPMVRKLSESDRYGNTHYGLNLILARREDYNFPEEIMARANNLTAHIQKVLVGVKIPQTDFIIGVCQHCRRKAQAKVRAGERAAWGGYLVGRSISQIREILSRGAKKVAYDASLERHKVIQPRYGRQTIETPEVKKGAEEAISRSKSRESLASILNKLMKEKEGKGIGAGTKKIIMASIEVNDENPVATVAGNPEFFGENKEAYEAFCKYAGTTPVPAVTPVSETGKAVPVEESTQ